MLIFRQNTLNYTTAILLVYYEIGKIYFRARQFQHSNSG